MAAAAANLPPFVDAALRTMNECKAISPIGGWEACHTDAPGGIWHLHVTLQPMPRAPPLRLEVILGDSGEQPDFLLLPPPPPAASPTRPPPSPLAEYSWVCSEPPPWIPAEPDALVRFLRWVLHEHAGWQHRRFLEAARGNERLSFEHAVSLAELGDRVRYCVSEGDRECVTVAVPLLREGGDVLFRRLENVLLLFEKIMAVPLACGGKAALRDVARHGAPPLRPVDFTFLCTVRAPRANPASLIVVSEAVVSESPAERCDASGEAEELAELVALLDICGQEGLPRFCDAVRDGQSLLDFLPTLEGALGGRCVAETLHWLQLVLALTPYFGSPAELNPFPRGASGAPAARVACFVITDIGSGMSVVVSVTYLGLTALPLVEFASPHHCTANDRDPIRISFHFPTRDDRRIVPAPTSTAPAGVADGHHSCLDVSALAEEIDLFFRGTFAKFATVCARNAES